MIEKRRSYMDSTVAGDDKPEEKPDEATSGEMTAPEEKPPAENPPADRPPGERNWILIALIAVSCVAVLLFASTIMLAVTGGCLLYTSDAADDLLCVDLGGRRIIKKKKKTQT